MDNKPKVKVTLNKSKQNDSEILHPNFEEENTLNEIVNVDYIEESPDDFDDRSKLDGLDLFIENCDKAGIKTYGSFTSLSLQSDIILATESEKAFWGFCIENGIKTAFYYMDFPSIEESTIDFEEVRELLTRQFKAETKYFNYKYPYIRDDFFDAALDSVLEKAEDEIATQNVITESLDEEEPYIIEYYCVMGSFKVGIIVGEENDTLDNIKSRRELLQEYNLEISKNIMALEETASEENALIEQQRKEDYNNALNEIEEFLLEDSKLMTMKFKNARQDYADKLRMEWGKKINQTITQKDVKAIVEKVYIERKEI